MAMKQSPNQERDGIPKARTWILVAGGFHRQGGMDAANASLASYLARRGCEVHVVGYRVDDELRMIPSLSVHEVRQPRGSFFLGAQFLDKAGRRIARRLCSVDPFTRVVVNGGNCMFPDINWVHSVHHAWPNRHDGAPAWFRIKSAINKWLARRNELLALRAARVVIANSNRTRIELITRLGLPPERVRTVYLGGEPHWRVATEQRRRAARVWLNLSSDRPVVAFVGALGYDTNKGFGTLWESWRQLCTRSDWNAELIVAGGGRRLDKWQSQTKEAGFIDRVRFLGTTNRMSDVIAASDLLVSPSHYEAYGLAAHEALCAGVPAIVSANAGIAERYPAFLEELLISDPADARVLASMIRAWKAEIQEWKQRIRPFSEELRSRGWDDMAAEIISVVEATSSISQSETI